MIAFVEDGTVAVGVVLEPVPQRVTYAIRGDGCWWFKGGKAKTACRVSTTAELSACVLTQSRPRQTGQPTKHVRVIGPARVIETYSAGIKLALVARGEADLYVNDYREFHDWDIAAGHILVEEAGGKVTGLKGETLRYGLAGAWQRQGLLATNATLQQAAIEKLEALDQEA